MSAADRLYELAFNLATGSGVADPRTFRHAIAEHRAETLREAAGIARTLGDHLRQRGFSESARGADGVVEDLHRAASDAEAGETP